MSELRNKLTAELIHTSWTELHAHLERGAVFEVCYPVPLLEAAVAIAEDQHAIIEAWIGSGHIRRVSASEEPECKTSIAAIIVQPYVCIQFADVTAGDTGTSVPLPKDDQ